MASFERVADVLALGVVALRHEKLLLGVHVRRAHVAGRLSVRVVRGIVNAVGETIDLFEATAVDELGHAEQLLGDAELPLGRLRSHGVGRLQGRIMRTRQTMRKTGSHAVLGMGVTAYALAADGVRQRCQRVQREPKARRQKLARDRDLSARTGRFNDVKMS